MSSDISALLLIYAVCTIASVGLAWINWYDQIEDMSQTRAAWLIVLAPLWPVLILYPAYVFIKFLPALIKSLINRPVEREKHFYL